VHGGLLTPRLRRLSMITPRMSFAAQAADGLPLRCGIPEWRAWVDSIASGDRADAHRQMMRRLGIKREHIRHQASPAGDVMVLVWEGVEQDRAPELLADLVQNPRSEHERYIATHVIPDIHGADPTAGPPPTVQNVATIET
jgi:hypothetical protein